MKRPFMAVSLTLIILLSLLWAGNLALRAKRAALAPRLQGQAGDEVVKGEMEGVELQSRDETSGVITTVSARKLSVEEGKAFLFFRSAIKSALMLRDPQVRLSSGKEAGVFSATGRLGLHDPLTRATRLSGGVRGDADGVVFVAVGLSLTADGFMSIEGDYTVEGFNGRLYRGRALKLEALKAGTVFRDMIAKRYLQEAAAPAVAPVTTTAPQPQEKVNNP